MKAIACTHLLTTAIIAIGTTARTAAPSVTFQVASREHFLGGVTINDHF